MKAKSFGEELLWSSVFYKHGFVLCISNTTIRDKKWKQRLKCLRAFQIKAGIVAPPKTADSSLAGWYYYNQNQFELGRFTKEKSKLWQGLPIQKEKWYASRSFEAWKEFWQELKDYQESSGQKAPLTKGRVKLYQFYAVNRARYISGILSEEKREMWLRLPLSR